MGPERPSVAAPNVHGNLLVGKSCSREGGGFLPVEIARKASDHSPEFGDVLEQILDDYWGVMLGMRIADVKRLWSEPR